MEHPKEYRSEVQWTHRNNQVKRRCNIYQFIHNLCIKSRVYRISSSFVMFILQTVGL